MAEKRKISLVLADVDGTLVTEEKILTERARKAVSALQEAGIRFAITSGRPPLGMAMLFDALDIETPIAGFNGGLFVERDLTILEQKTVPTDVARQAVELMRKHGLDTWVYSGNDWLITKIDAPHVAREAWTVKFEPKVVANLTEHLQQVAKIVGVSNDLDKLQRCEADSQAAFGQHATANRSQPYYLDVTNKDANKGAVVEYLSRHLGVPAHGDRHPLPPGALHAVSRHRGGADESQLDDPAHPAGRRDRARVRGQASRAERDAEYGEHGFCVQDLFQDGAQHRIRDAAL